MAELRTTLKNCYGITHLAHTFNLGDTDKNGHSVSSAYAIYAPNGLMKTSFAKTFANLAAGEAPREERHNKQAEARIKLDGEPITPESIYVLPAEPELALQEKPVSNLLVNADKKAEYDALVADIENSKKSLINDLQKATRVKKDDVIKTLEADFPDSNGWLDALKQALILNVDNTAERFRYQDIFNSKAQTVLQDNAFLSQATAFSDRYRALFEQDGTIYTQGVFNPIKAGNAFDSLDKQGYFKAGHKVQFAGETQALDQQELDTRVKEINKRINDDDELKKIQASLAKNADTQKIAGLLENETAGHVQWLLDNLQPDRMAQFKQQLWAGAVQQSHHAQSLVAQFEDAKTRLESIEQQANQEAGQWRQAVNRFNDRFVDMPFTLSVANMADATLGRAGARLVFHFKDDDTGDEAKYNSSNIEKAQLSQGEKRAFYLLNFIFAVEWRKKHRQRTLFIIDDPADAFDYKNKHAIIQYLRDLSETDFFHQIILTHNFDFYRSLSSFVAADRRLMANRTVKGVKLEKANDIVSNPFTNHWKKEAHKDPALLCATIPFTRNIVEYIRGAKDADYLTLTNLMHWKPDTYEIKTADYWTIYQTVFNEQEQLCDDAIQPMITLLFEQAEKIANESPKESLNLANKVVLSMAIRLAAEQVMISRLRQHYADENWWPECNSNQFGYLMTAIRREINDHGLLTVLDQVSITVSSNIHLNSFMYEPILDLTIVHLVKLYKKIGVMAK